eukprot:TRINITY_DN107382_c0_g1_i1.p1 TRINITY_DN107382_c0_g1~~TRINITY_DN107382_c0_g1_i1.p1  ORF type:complete len:276 (-),score=50.04 TRINITY_DN107382_c0_g1_i1:292-1119(-)
MLSSSQGLDGLVLPTSLGDIPSTSVPIGKEPAKLSQLLRSSSALQSDLCSPTVSRSLGLTSFSVSRPAANPSAAWTAPPPNVQEPHGSEDEEGTETFQVTCYSHQTAVTVRWLPDLELAFAGTLELESPVQALRECIAEATRIPLNSQLLLAEGKLLKEDSASLQSVLDADKCECFLMRMPTVEAERPRLSCPFQAFATLRGPGWEPMITLIDSHDDSVVGASPFPEADGGLKGFAFSDTCARLEFCTSEGEHYLDLADMTLHLKLDYEEFSERV